MHTSKLIQSIFVFILSTILACSDKSPSPFPPAKSKFIRFVQTDDLSGRLESAIVSYENKRGVRVDLVAALHLADPEYYQRLKIFFTAYDALLFEMILPSGADLADMHSDSSLLSWFQRSLCQSMNLSFQLDAIDYTQPNFVHADLTVGELQRLWNKRGESIWKLILRTLTAQNRAMDMGLGSKLTTPAILEALRSEDTAERMKFLLAQEFENIEAVLACFGESEESQDSILVGERNKAAIETLAKQIKKGQNKLAIFFGAGHMPDLELRLQRDLAFKKTGQEWFTAWRVGK